MSDSVTLFIGLRSIEPIQYASPLMLSSEISDLDKISLRTSWSINIYSLSKLTFVGLLITCY